jgi:hypothetical protein
MARRDSLQSLPHYRSVLGILDQIIAGKNYIHSIRVSYPICRMRLSGICSFLCGAREPFPAAAMVVVLVLFS